LKALDDIHKKVVEWWKRKIIYVEGLLLAPLKEEASHSAAWEYSRVP